MLAVIGGKGGTGKTTTALGIAVTASSRRRDPVVVETDVDMPNLHIRAGVDDDGIDRLASGRSLEDASSVSSTYPGVDVIGARPGAALVPALRAIVTDRPVVLDGPAGAAERAVTPIRFADAAVVVTRDTPASITDTEKTLRMSRAVGTPVIAAIVSRATDVSGRIADVLDVGEIVAIPEVDDPVTGAVARVGYSKIIETWANA
ncbi:MAG: MinD/ParA family protein [Halodesulfurarchaeum sp.]